MTQLLLILALLVPGLRPGPSCGHAQDDIPGYTADDIPEHRQDRSEALADPACVTCCPADRCQAARCEHPASSRPTPATPPRGGDVAPPLLPAGRHLIDGVYRLSAGPVLPGPHARRLGDEARRFESAVCRWLT